MAATSVDRSAGRVRGTDSALNRRRGLIPVLVPFVVAAVFLLLELHVTALIVGSLAILGLAVRVVRPSAHARLVGALFVLGGWLATGLGWLLLGIVHLVVFLPTWCLGRVLRRDVLTGLRTTGWRRVPLDGSVSSTRAFGLEPGRIDPGRLTIAGLVRSLPALVGWVVLAGVANFVAGYAVDWITGDRDEAAQRRAIGAVGPIDERADLPAYEGQEWVDGYFAELASLDYEYLPFIETRMRPFSGRYINGGDGERRSEQQVPDDADVPVVWFLGGSTMWGEGQRDTHTIPSEVARLAAEDGLPVRVLNLGERGYVSRQELELFERELGIRPNPDVAVFYDGTNDMNVQRPTFNEDRYLDGVPTIYDVSAYDQALNDRSAAAAQAESLYERYVDRSLVHGVVDRLRSLIGGEPAEAAVAVDQQTDGIIDRALSVYERSRAGIIDIAGRSGVEPVFFWQPEQASQNPGSDYSRATARVGEPTIDIADSLDGVPVDDVYIDGGHTNELGARLVAEEMWRHLEPVLRSLG